jgi:hypothetical protein
MLGTLLKWITLDTDSAKKRPKLENHAKSSLTRLYDGDRGVFDLHSNSAELRLWLPAVVKLAMDECINEMEVSAAKYLREFFVIYLYGAHELLRMQRNKTGIYYKPPPKLESSRGNSVMFSRSPTEDCVPGLGKNIIPIKLFLNEKIKIDLETLAKQAAIPLGQLARELIISHFLGHTIWPERNTSLLDEERRIAEEWVCGHIKEENVR